MELLLAILSVERSANRLPDMYGNPAHSTATAHSCTAAGPVCPTLEEYAISRLNEARDRSADNQLDTALGKREATTVTCASRADTIPEALTE